MLTNKGFTLIEIFIVFMIVALLAAINIPILMKGTKRLNTTEDVVKNQSHTLSCQCTE